ncbi:MAG: glycoside hydrolase family 13 protein [Clostridiales bacterium]|nr:glycoside hydrolase family 13 protein [Clostridiales bacterium]
MDYVRYNPTDEFHKSIVGAVAENVQFGIRLQIHQKVAPTCVRLVIYGDSNGFYKEYTMYLDHSGDGYDNFVADVKLKKGLYWYYFVMDGVTFERYIGIDDNQRACMYYDSVRPWQLSVYKKQYDTPTWLNGGVMYQIMVDRFCATGDTVANEDKILRHWGEQPFFREEDGVVRNRDFFGGNIKGVTSKLPYLASLNVKTIYLNPIFKAYSNHKYDTEDYEIIDPMFGTLEDFTELIEQADKYGIKVILDGVFNHVGASSKYFNRDRKYGDGGAYNDVNSPYRDWFNIYPDGSYECWWNFQSLPRVNAFNADAQKYFTGKNGIVRQWLKAGASGWRLDVVDEIADEMLDKIVTAAKKEKPDAVIIGEVWEDASNKVDYGVRRHYLDGSQLDSVMNYPLMNAIIAFVRDGNESALSHVVFDLVNNYPGYIRNNLMNILGTHDTIRILTNLAGNRLDNASKEVMAHTKLTDQQYKEGCKLLKIAAVLQYTMFGFPCVYYGDEVAMEGYKDPFCRCCYPWGEENKLMLDFYRRLGELRKLSVFADGHFHQLVAEKGVYAFERVDTDTQTQVIVAVNRGSDGYNLYLGDVYEDALTGRKYNNTCHLQRNGYVILIRPHA